MQNMLKPCAFVAKSVIDATLKSQPTQGKRLLEPLLDLAKARGLPFNILEDVNVDNEPEVHRHEADLWHCLHGKARFIVEGKLVGPRTKKLPDGTEDTREIKAQNIDGGKEHVLEPGDWLWVPAGQPHQHSAKGVARLVIIKIPQPEVPLISVPGWK